MKKELSEVTFFTYPALLFTWPVILMGFILWTVDALGWGDSETMAWIWGLTILVVILTIGVDIGRNIALFLLVTLVALSFIGMWLRDVKQVTILGDLFRYLSDLDPTYSRSLGLIVSLFLSVPFLVMLAWTRLNSKWRITHNEFEHCQLGRVDDSLARGAKRIRSSYPDLLEFLLCLAGELKIYDSSGNTLLRSIPHVPFLPWVRRKIDRLMESTAVTSTAVLDDESEAAGGGDRSEEKS